MTQAQFVSFSALPYKPLSDRVSSRMMAGKELMFIEHKVKKGHRAIDERHENEQLTFVLQGLIRVTLEKGSHLLKAGDAVLIPSGVVHTVEVLEDSSVIEVFSPPRREWLGLSS